MAILDDINCIERTLSGDTSAFSVLVERYQTMVFSLIVRVVYNQHDAEDIAQEVFVKAFRSLDKFRNEARFSTWLCRIAYTSAISHTRKQQPVHVEIEDNHYAEFAFDVDDLQEERLSKLQKYLSQLPPDDAMLVSLYYQDDKSIEEVAEIANLTVSNVKVRLHRIRKRLYQNFRDDE